MQPHVLRPTTPWAASRPLLRGDVRGGFTSASLTLVSTVTYAAVAAAPLGASSSAAAVVSGLIGAALGGAIASSLGPVPTQIFSPRASVAVVIASATTMVSHQVAPGPEAAATVVAWMAVCLLTASLLQWLFGALRMGGLIRLVPYPVTAGFTVGIAIKMLGSQWPHLMNSPMGDGAAAGLGTLAPLLVAASVVAAIFWAQWRGWSGWAMPIGLLAGVAAHQLMNRGLGVQPLPSLQAIHFDVAPLYSLAGLTHALHTAAGLELLLNLLGFALVIALVNSIETLTSAVALEDLTHQRFDANRVLTAGALGSVVAVCAGGLPVGGGAATSVANLRCGASTHRSGHVAAVSLVVMIFTCGIWVDQVPMAVVAGIMITVAFALAREPLADITASWRLPTSGSRRNPGELAVAALVCTLLLSTGILTAVLGGITAATVLIVLQMRRTLVRRQYDANDPGVASRLGFAIEPKQGRRVQIFEVIQPLFFATAEPLVQLIERIDRSARFAIIDLTHGGAADATAMRVLARCCNTLLSRKQRMLIVVGPHACAFDMASMPCRTFTDLNDALAYSTAPRDAKAPLCDAHALTPTTQTDSAVQRPSFERFAGSNTSHRRNSTMPKFSRASLSLAVARTQPVASLAPALIEQAARELALFVGPVAKVLALRAATRCTGVGDLYRLLALELTSADERAAFLLNRPHDDVDEPAPKARTDSLVLVSSLPSGLSSGLALTPEVLAQATRDLSPYLGPLSKLLVSRAHAKALDREHLYRLLARQLGSATQREAFLLAAGVQLRPFDALQR